MIIKTIRQEQEAKARELFLEGYYTLVNPNNDNNLIVCGRHDLPKQLDAVTVFPVVAISKKLRCRNKKMVVIDHAFESSRKMEHETEFTIFLVTEGLDTNSLHEAGNVH